jgi:DNA-directed RNA polymerase subunit RPC12/RpoP
MMCDVYDGKLRFGCYHCSQKLVELIRLPNSFVCIIGNAHLQKTLRKQLGRNSEIAVKEAAQWRCRHCGQKCLRQEREAKGIFPR